MEIDLSEYLKFTNNDSEMVPQGSIAESVQRFHKDLDFQNFDVAILFVPSDLQQRDPEFADAQKNFEHSLSKLYKGNFQSRILYMGALVLGRTEADTQSALGLIIDFLVSRRITPFIIGASRNVNYPAYCFFKESEQLVSITSIDCLLNVGCDDRDSYLAKIVTEQPNFLFNFSNIGYQTYLVSDKELLLSEELYFDSTRLGELRGNIRLTEPIIRASEILTASLDALKYSDFHSMGNPQPNGFYAEDICQMMRYAGLSERLKVVLITDFKPVINSKIDELLLAEMFWCFLDGFYSRKPEMPHHASDSFLKYRVALQDDEFHLTFYKSLKTDRWWMEVPVPPHYNQKYRKHQLIPCSYEDYIMATNNELPDRWWKAYKKML